MLPPIDETVLKSNPNFAALYANLSGNILNPDGATKHLSAHKEQDEVSKVCFLCFSANLRLMTMIRPTRKLVYAIPSRMS